MQLEVHSESRIGSDVQEEGSLRGEVGGTSGFRIEVRHKAFGEGMDGTNNVSRDRFTNVVVFHEEILGMTWKVRSESSSDGWSRVRLDDSWCRLREENPVTEGTIEFD